MYNKNKDIEKGVYIHIDSIEQLYSSKGQNIEIDFVQSVSNTDMARNRDPKHLFQGWSPHLSSTVTIDDALTSLLGNGERVDSVQE